MDLCLIGGLSPWLPDQYQHLLTGQARCSRRAADSRPDPGARGATRRLRNLGPLHRGPHMGPGGPLNVRLSAYCRHCAFVTNVRVFCSLCTSMEISPLTHGGV